jgi:hypothetical protein
MRTPQYHVEIVLNYLRKNKIATIEDIKAALGKCSDATVYRKLQGIPHLTSYSHRGRFHTLEEIAAYDALGLWDFRDVWFSKHGTLLSTVEALVGDSRAGYFAAELEDLLHVPIKVPALKLVHEDRLSREKLSGRYLYCSPKPERRREQVSARRLEETEPSLEGLSIDASGRLAPDELKAAIVLFFSLLDEQQRRLYAGLESLKLGHGGDRRIADLLGLSTGTVSKGRSQLLDRDVQVGRARTAGGGRSFTEKKRRK